MFTTAGTARRTASLKEPARAPGAVPGLQHGVARRLVHCGRAARQPLRPQRGHHEQQRQGDGGGLRENQPEFFQGLRHESGEGGLIAERRIIAHSRRTWNPRAPSLEAGSGPAPAMRGIRDKNHAVSAINLARKQAFRYTRAPWLNGLRRVRGFSGFSRLYILNHYKVSR